MRVPFSSLFEQNPDGSLTPKVPVRRGGAQVMPGVPFGGSVSFVGVNFAQYVGKDLEVEVKEDGVYLITDVYP